ncbi:MAG TPA: flagellar protein FlgN [Gammaproteobacteria bacterium]|nr:flagellar protein FlgN [Gammaproteobacteria bacterium]
MHAEKTQHPLEKVLAQEVQCTGRLLECLEAERSALTRRDLELLEKTTQGKIQYTRQLEELETQRETLVAELGFASGANALLDCFKSLPEADNFIGLWKQVLENTQACQAGNLTNGGVLESSRRHVEQALSILRGQPGTPSLYDPNGDTSANLGQRELGKV